MAADNHTTIIGNLAEDPEVRFTHTGIAVTNLRVAVTQRVQQDGQWRDGETSFFKVNLWRGQAEHWPTPWPRATGSWSPGGCASGPGRRPRGEAVGHRDRGRRGRGQPEVGHGQGRALQPARPRRPLHWARSAGRARRRLQRRTAVLSLWLTMSAPLAPARGAAYGSVRYRSSRRPAVAVAQAASACSSWLRDGPAGRGAPRNRSSASACNPWSRSSRPGGSRRLHPARAIDQDPIQLPVSPVGGDLRCVADTHEPPLEALRYG